MSKTVYITTPLYYVNAAPHIGHSYTSVAADALARYHRLKGDPVFLLTGTDEHGQKIAQAAAAAGEAPQAFVDSVVEHFKALWNTLNIQYDYFIRTTEARHSQAVQDVLQSLHDAGKLKQAAYQGWYCTPDETFWTQEEIGTPSAAPACPQCQRPLESAKEDGWYLELRAAQEWLRGFVNAHPAFIQPATRYNEIRSLLEQPLPEYLCITRPKHRVAWGIPVPFSGAHVTYVWFDALLNYITAPQFLDREAELWPADVHVIGKDILRHHAVYWPIMLHAMGVPDARMPQRIFAHGWWKIGEQKMSKSLGNIVDPTVVIGQLLKGQPFAADIYRYFLLREVPFGHDGNFSEEALLTRLEADLANDLGNLVHRTLSMLHRYTEGKVPAGGAVGCAEDDASLQREALALARVVDDAMAALSFSTALEAIMRLVSHANQYIERQAPWQLAKGPHQDRLGSVLAMLAELLRIVAIALEPFLPSVTEAMWQQLGCGDRPRTLAELTRWPGLDAGHPVGTPRVLFPRLEGVPT